MAHFPVDLHAHTTASDGSHTPTRLVERAAQRGLQVLAITDHDTIDGVVEAQAAGRLHDIQIVPGIELSTRHDYSQQFVGIHLLGYFIDVTDADLRQTINRVQQGRIDQKVHQIKKLQTFGFDIPVEAVFDQVSGVPGRPHIAAVLMERNPGRFETIQQIFDEYLGAGKKAHVRRSFSLSVAEAIGVVKAAGGLPVFAHPGAYQAVSEPLTAVRNAHAAGVEGVEVYYPYNTGRHPNRDSRWIGRLEQEARSLGLLVSGGTDFHGRPHKNIDLGDMGLTEAQFAALQQGWQAARGITGKR